MNVKTTLILFVLVVILGAGIVLLKEKAPPPAPEVPTASTMTTTPQVDQPLFEGEFGDAIDITVSDGGDEWKFVKSETDDEAEWTMAAPTAGRVQKWQVEQIARRVSDLKYTVKYGSEEMTAADAGLDPPRNVVTVTDSDGNTRTLHIGRNEGSQETLVSVGDDGAIYRVKPSLKSLIKKKAIEYLDQQLFKLTADEIVSVSIQEAGSSGETYELLKTGAEWRFEQPSEAKAMPDVVRTFCTTFAGLRVANWVESDVQDPTIYGLGDDAMTITVIAEQKPAPPADATTNGDEPEPAPEAHTYVIRVSSASPIGDENKVYVRRGDEKLVGTLIKTVADKLKPDLKTWRDNRLLERDPTLARRVSISTGGAEAAFVRAAANWAYEEGGEPADRETMDALLGAIKETAALNFVSGAAADPASFGLDAPQTTIELSFDGVEEPTRIVVGGFADPQTRRLVYVQTDGSDSVAKVRVTAANSMVKKPVAFRDRTAVAVPRDRIESITIARVAGENTEIEPAMTFTLAKADDAWSMTAPVAEAVEQPEVEKLLSVLAGIRGRKLYDIANSGSLADYGLDNPTVTLTYSYLPPQTYKVEPADAGTNGATTVTPEQPPAESRTIRIARRDRQAYLVRAESESVVYEIDPAIVDTLSAEYHNKAIFAFEEPQVSKVAFTSEEITQGLERTDAGWSYTLEPDIPVDATKITNYLLRVKDLKIDRVVTYEPADLATYGLDAPVHELSVELNGLPMPKLLISGKTTEAGQIFAKAESSDTILLLPADAVNRIRIDVAEFETQP